MKKTYKALADITNEHMALQEGDTFEIIENQASNELKESVKEYLDQKLIVKIDKKESK